MKTLKTPIQIPMLRYALMLMHVPLMMPYGQPYLKNECDRLTIIFCATGKGNF